jgi:AcrR family transcriptional regulator
MNGTHPSDTTTARERPRRTRAGTQQKLENLLAIAAALIAEKGYEQTAIRDVGRETGVSLPGMYYYFKSKEDLLFQIQHRTFASLLQAQQAVFDAGDPPERKLGRLIVGHLEFYAQHPNEMKVCTFELESMRGEPYEAIKKLRRRYYGLVASVIGDALGCSGRGDAGELLVRHLTLFGFGMLNWIFMWYDPARDGPVERLGEEMTEMVLHGVGGEFPGNRRLLLNS